MKICHHCHLEKEPSEFGPYRYSKDKLNYWCRLCHKEYARQRRIANPWKQREQDLKLYNISPAQVEEMLKQQDYKCASCFTPLDYIPSAGRRIQVNIDHDHSCCPGRSSCGKCIRAVLCSPCNHGLGIFKDNADHLRKAANYVEKFLQKGVLR